jgi:hypothetical protein
VIDMNADDAIERVASSLDSISLAYHGRFKKLVEEPLSVWAGQFLMDINELSGQIYQLWNMFVKERLYFLDTIEIKEEFMEEY